MKPLLVVLLSLAVLALAGTVLAKKTPEEDAAEAVRRADAAFNDAVQAKDFGAFKDLIAEDAVFYGGQGPTVGRAAVVERWAEFFLPEPRSRLAWIPKSAVASDSGDMAYTLGEYEASGSDRAGKPAVKRGHYVTIWRKGADGKWRVAVDIGTQGQ